MKRCTASACQYAAGMGAGNGSVKGNLEKILNFIGQATFFGFLHIFYYSTGKDAFKCENRQLYRYIVFSQIPARMRSSLFYTLSSYMYAAYLLKAAYLQYNIHDEWSLVSGGIRCT